MLCYKHSTDLPVVDNGVGNLFAILSEQMEGHECDIITGFHIEDSERHVLVLEGLHRMGIRELWTNLPHHPTQGKQDVIVDI